MRSLVKVAVATVLVDQVTKILVVHGLNLKEALVYPVWSPYLEFRMAWNEGINFGLLSSSAGAARWLLIALARGISLWIWRWAAGDRKNRAAQVISGWSGQDHTRIRNEVPKFGLDTVLPGGRTWRDLGPDILAIAADGLKVFEPTALPDLDPFKAKF